MNNVGSHETIDNKSDLAIVVVSYDGYSDLWDDFFTLLNKYWADRPYHVYLVNNLKKPNYENVTVINCGADAQWSTRTRVAVEQIKTSYICLLLEDYFVGATIDNRKIEEALEFIKHNKIQYYKLTNVPKGKKHYKNSNYLYQITQNLEYGISLQAAIWERNYLLEHLGDGDYNAWKFEVDRVKQCQKKLDHPLSGCIIDSRNILNICHGVAKGKYLPSAIRFFKKQNYYLNTSKRSAMSTLEYAVFNLKVYGKELVPRAVRKPVKKLLKKFGMKFVLE